MMDVTLLGTSALLPLPERAETAAVLTCAGHAILFDCGEGTQTAARRAGVSIMSLDMIALTHYHGDHTFGLPGLLQTMGCLERMRPLTITGPQGLRQAMESILTLAGPQPYPIRLMDMPESGMDLHELDRGWPDGACLTAFKTQHRVPSQGYAFTLRRRGKFMPEAARRLGVPVQAWGLLQGGQSVSVGGSTIRPEQVMGAERPGLKVVFSGDTAICDALIESARGADLLMAEATYGEHEQEEWARTRGHMTFAQAATVAAQAGVRRLWLMHYSQRMEEPEDFLPNAQAVFPDAVCGRDGMTMTLRFAEG